MACSLHSSLNICCQLLSHPKYCTAWAIALMQCGIYVLMRIGHFPVFHCGLHWAGSMQNDPRKFGVSVSWTFSFPCSPTSSRVGGWLSSLPFPQKVFTRYIFCVWQRTTFPSSVNRNCASKTCQIQETWLFVMAQEAATITEPELSNQPEKVLP